MGLNSIIQLRVVLLHLIQIRFKQMELTDPEIISAQRILEIAEQPEEIQARYIDNLHFNRKTQGQMLYIFAAIESLTQPIHSNFKTKILAFAKARAKQLHMYQGSSLEEQKFALEKQKYQFYLKLQNQKIRNESIKLILMITWIIIIAFGIYVCLLQPRKIVVPSEAEIQTLKFDSILQGVESSPLVVQPYSQSQQQSSPHVAVPKPQQE